MPPGDNLPVTSAPCLGCGTTIQWKKPPKTDRLPQGWKRRGGEIFCSACWRKKYILRAVTIPVASPLDCSWDELQTSLHSMWATTTAASNWMLTEMYARDIRRTGATDKLPPMPRVYLYPEARIRFPALPSQSVAALEQAVGRKYRAKRYDVVWTCAASLPTYRYPTPFGIPNQGWSVEMDQQKPIVSARVGDKRLRLRLKNGAEFRRQLHAVRLIVAGEAEQGQMDLYRQGHGKAAIIMCKMVAWLPRRACDAAEGTLIVRSTPDAILQAFNLKDEAIWTYHGDHLLGWIAEHGKFLQRLADDTKAEMRPPTESFQRHRREAVERFHRRMSTATHEIAAMLVGHAQRRKFAEIQYNDSDQSFGKGLPWAELRRKIAEKADAAGIVFTPASAPAVEKTAGPLANEETE
jgi:hypothetical protein